MQRWQWVAVEALPAPMGPDDSRMVEQASRRHQAKGGWGARQGCRAQVRAQSPQAIPRDPTRAHILCTGPISCSIKESNQCVLVITVQNLQ